MLKILGELESFTSRSLANLERRHGRGWILPSPPWDTAPEIYTSTDAWGWQSPTQVSTKPTAFYPTISSSKRIIPPGHFRARRKIEAASKFSDPTIVYSQGDPPLKESNSDSEVIATGDEIHERALDGATQSEINRSEEDRTLQSTNNQPRGGWKPIPTSALISWKPTMTKRKGKHAYVEDVTELEGMSMQEGNGLNHAMPEIVEETDTLNSIDIEDPDPEKAYLQPQQPSDDIRVNIEPEDPPSPLGKANHLDDEGEEEEDRSRPSSALSRVRKKRGGRHRRERHANIGMETLLVYRAVLWAALAALAADTSCVYETEIGERVVQVL